ncbi:acyl carrier protein [Pseudidiomarina sediminum]|uniref:Acyl carrier protein n=1 Tax=Pseudidiomarina sediminum TaxID=431675 RepID=A0A432Z283_9GAMM|nr:phosphopantetheine-binding protein [Pseudidiomarina sediminum]MBY6064336.1 acyl carrier protein [Pseudidiomarina sediminum]RUO72012.1 acyl carrier protein [Pseudidiomarina sediminum]
METLKQELKTLIIEALDLEDVGVADIRDDAPLFSDENDGLDLDSIDALELGLAIKKAFDVKLDANATDTKQHFYSVNTLADFITSQKG